MIATSIRRSESPIDIDPVISPVLTSVVEK